VGFAKEKGLSLTGPEGLLKQFAKSVLETALNEEMTEHLGHEKNRAARSTRPLSEFCAAILIDATLVKIRDGQVANRPVYAAIGVSLAGGERRPRVMGRHGPRSRS